MRARARATAASSARSPTAARAASRRAVGEMGAETRRRRRPRRARRSSTPACAPPRSGSARRRSAWSLAVPPERRGRAARALRGRGRRGDGPRRVHGHGPPRGRATHGETHRRPRHGRSCTRASRRSSREASWAPPPPAERPARPRARPRAGAARAAARRPTSRARSGSSASTTTRCRRGSVVKPLVGVAAHGPSRRGRASRRSSRSRAGFALGVRHQPALGDLDPYAMARGRDRRGAAQRRRASAAIPTRMRDPRQLLLGQLRRSPTALGALVRRARGLPRRGARLRHAVHLRQGLAEQRVPDRRRDDLDPATRCSSPRSRSCPTSRQAVTMDLKAAGNRLVLVGATAAELGGSTFHSTLGPPRRTARRGSTARAPGASSSRCTPRSRAGASARCHDLSDGGLPSRRRRWCFAGGLGARARPAPRARRRRRAERRRARVLREPHALPARGRARCASRRSRSGFAGPPVRGHRRDDGRSRRSRSSARAARAVSSSSAAALDAAWRPPLTRQLEGDPAS